MTTRKQQEDEILAEKLNKLARRLAEDAVVSREDLDVIREAKHAVEGQARHPPNVVLYLENSEKWSIYFRNGKRDLSTGVAFSSLSSVDHPVLEALRGDRYRLVVEVSTEMAKELREVFEIPMQPAPLDATESLVRAAHGMAGAAIELGSVAREVKTALTELRKR